MVYTQLMLNNGLKKKQMVVKLIVLDI